MNNIKETMQNTTNHYYIKIISFILFAGIFAGCSNDDNKRGSGQLRFRTSQENMNDVTRSGESEVLHREQIILDNGMILDITLQEDFENTIATRTLDPLSKGEYTILGYDAITDEFIDKTEGEIDGAGVFSAKDEVEFPINRTYNFVCVANVSTLDADNKKATVVRNSALRQTISTTVTNQTLTADEDKEINFLMKHTESRMRVKLKGEGFSNVQAYLLPSSGSHPKSVVWNIYKNDFTTYPTDESVINDDITRADYTFSFNDTSGDDLVSEYKYLLPGTSGADLMLNLVGKISDVDYNGSIKLRNLGVLDRNKSYLVTAAVKINSGSGDILYFATVNGQRKLMIGTWPDDIGSHNDLAFFKFGSVIGFRNSGGKVTTSRIAFDPSRLFVGNDDSDYATIPSWDNENFATYNAANDWDKYSYCPSGSNYHTVANIKLGKGDPCKLAGFTENDIISKLNAGDLPDNGLWRLPTKAEQLGYIKGTLTVTGTTFKDSIWNYWNTLSSWSDKENYPYATFPFINSSEVNPLGSRLPAAGRTNSLGWAQNLHAVGSYWSSSPNSETGSRIVTFDATSVISEGYNHPADGCTIRCVPQVP